MDTIIAAIRGKIHLPSALPFYATLGAVVGTHLDTHQPVWLMHVGPPGCGKSLMLSLFEDLLHSDTLLPVMAELGNPTGLAAFLTARKPSKKTTKGNVSSATGGLLNKLGDFGIITSKDFTTILQKQPDTKAEIIAALREIYDGKWTRPTGSEGGESLTWGPGKVGFVGCVTNAIDRHYSVISELGDRWLYWRWPTSNQHNRLAAMYAMTNKQGFVKPYAEMIMTYLHSLGLRRGMSTEQYLTEHDLDRVFEMASLLSCCRINVQRDMYHKSDYQMPQIESENRSSAGMVNIYNGMQWAGVSQLDSWKVLYRLLIDSIPAIRSRIVTALLRGTPMYAAELARYVPCGNPTVGYALEDLELAGVVERAATIGTGAGNKQYWKLTDATFKVLRRVSGLIEAREEEYDEVEIDLSYDD
jgi:DNA-binding PadR family transcriptional regulator